MANRRFKVSNDPRFEEKLVDVVGLYLNPPERAVVLSFDEKTQVQALDRTQPSLPMRPGQAGTMTHDYKRNVGTGEVLTDCRKHHKGADVLRFFKLIDDRRLRRRTFNSVAVLVDAIETWVEHWNDNPKSFVWHKTAEEIGAKVPRGRAALAEVKCATQD